ncbi:MAG: 2-oxo-4-hydroxy-4-carboxy-5-ureidoimidazoline decarboxylase [Cyanobacteria bacterium J06648_11]
MLVPTIPFATVNQMERDRFVATLGAIFEQTPEIAAAVWPQRPFNSVDDLHAAMVNEMRSLPTDRQLDLIRAHPELGSRAEMAPASEKEQSGAGLQRLSPEDFARFQTLNRTYRDKCGFPFVLAVKTRTKADILEAFDRRLQRSTDEEFREALAQIAEIARLRLNEAIAD